MLQPPTLPFQILGSRTRQWPHPDSGTKKDKHLSHSWDIMSFSHHHGPCADENIYIWGQCLSIHLLVCFDRFATFILDVTSIVLRSGH